MCYLPKIDKSSVTKVWFISSIITATGRDFSSWFHFFWLPSIPAIFPAIMGGTQITIIFQCLTSKSFSLAGKAESKHMIELENKLEYSRQNVWNYILASQYLASLGNGKITVAYYGMLGNFIHFLYILKQTMCIIFI